MTANDTKMPFTRDVFSLPFEIETLFESENEEKNLIQNVQISFSANLKCWEGWTNMGLLESCVTIAGYLVKRAEGLWRLWTDSVGNIWINYEKVEVSKTFELYRAF